MPIEVTREADRNIVIATYSDPFSPEDVVKTMAETTKHYDPNGEKLYSVSDTTQLNLSFSDLVVALASATTHADGWRIGAPNSVTIFVGSADLLLMGREALKQEQYGAVQVELFEDLVTALNWIRSQPE